MTTSGILKGLRLNISPSEQKVTELISKIDFPIDQDYFSLIRKHNGGDGFINNSFLQLWSVEDVILLNPYCEEDADGGYSMSVFFIGSNGGGDGYGIVKSTGNFIEVPFIGMSEDQAQACGVSFPEFLLFLSRQR